MDHVISSAMTDFEEQYTRPVSVSTFPEEQMCHDIKETLVSRSYGTEILGVRLTTYKNLVNLIAI